jgi:hypothetical protein
MAVGGSVSTRIMVDPDTPRCFQVSAILCIVFNFTDSGGRELRGREKEKKKKKSSGSAGAT